MRRQCDLTGVFSSVDASIQPDGCFFAFGNKAVAYSLVFFPCKVNMHRLSICEQLQQSESGGACGWTAAICVISAQSVAQAGVITSGHKTAHEHLHDLKCICIICAPPGASE